MSTVMLVIAIIAVGVLALVLWNVLAWPRLRKSGSQTPCAISVLIPARDEMHNLPTCLRSLIECDDTVGEILVYDDHSTDNTAEVIQSFAEEDSRVRRLEPDELQPGWCGKTFACFCLAANAKCHWLLFLDADTDVAADTPNRLLAEASARKATMVSAWPGIEMHSFWEQLLMPVLNFLVLTLYPAPLAFLRKDDASLGLAHGACIFLSREAYMRTGGHKLVRDEIFEDTRLARRWREAGERSYCVDGQDAVRVRMYRSLGQIWNGFQKNFYPAFERTWTFALFMMFHFVVFLAPILLLVPLELSGEYQAVFYAGVAAFTVLLTRGLLAQRFRHPNWSCLLHPFAEIVCLGIGLASWWKCRSGRGVAWKGRTYRAKEQESENKITSSVSEAAS